MLRGAPYFPVIINRLIENVATHGIRRWPNRQSRDLASFAQIPEARFRLMNCFHSAGGELALSGSDGIFLLERRRRTRQFVYFSNEKLTIAATIEVEDIRGGVALVRVRTKCYPGTVGRETSEKELKSALPREYTYVPMEKLSLAVDGGGVLSLEGAIADGSWQPVEAIASLPVGPEAGQIMLWSPAILRGDRVMVNLKVGAATGSGLLGNPAIALYVPPEGLFIFALQLFDGATACEVTLGKAMFSLGDNDSLCFRKDQSLVETRSPGFGSYTLPSMSLPE
jgi:hypothetical protein